MDTLEQKINFFAELISCNYAIELTTYDQDMNFIQSNGENSHVFDKMLEYSDAKQSILEYSAASGQHYPVVLSDSFDLIWIACFEKKDGAVKRIHLLGPAYISEYAINSLQSKLDYHNISLSLRKMILNKITQVPIIIRGLYFQYAIMLHYCLTEAKISAADLQYVSPDEKESINPDFDEADAFDPDKSHTGVWAAEQRMLSMIEEGNLNYHEALSSVATLSRGVKIRTTTPLAQAKASVITFTALCSRAAIKGGLLSGMAYTIGDYYVQSIENAKSVSELGIISHEMYEDFVLRVHNLKQAALHSATVQNIHDYVQMHIEDRFSLGDIAQQLGYTEYYLSKKYKKETGSTLNDYIQQKKIDHAKLLLRTTKYSVQEIGDRLHFSSRSHFSAVFQKWTNQTPKEYRVENYRN
ncbi:helix-turn-helix domain-containing protein [Trichococcus ilyis]|uniref:AraC-type DNA-binding protein n=1 Tax=Trichococcus ilyis TaxID=640938 RepID=A0A143YR46_9LACT|nr:AraC family transcriptional regulator [Trichococcus ilyis]CZQ96557.1 helix turn helix arabinose operon control protein [Trichococcus ilyis]SEJ52075.1 AraC-type DNA-binding protein [Trichococcus ilyis]